MSGDFTNKLLTPTLKQGGAGSVAANVIAWTASCDCTLIACSCALETLGGGGSGATTVMLRNDTDTLDMLSAVMSIAHDADPHVATGTVSTTAANVHLDLGDVVEVDMDAEATGAAEAGLVVYPVFVGR